jgi:hypothetical protein
VISADTEDGRKLLILRCGNSDCVEDKAAELQVSPAEISWKIYDITGQEDEDFLESEDSESNESEVLPN